MHSVTQVKWRPLFWTSFHKVSTVITAYTRETKDELYQDLESSDPRDSVDRELADFAQKKKKKKEAVCLVLVVLVRFYNMYSIWPHCIFGEVIDIEKILALALEDNSRERSSPSGKKKQIIATYAEYKK